MQREPDNRNRQRSPEQENYRRRTEAKAKRRKKRRTQRLLLLGAFALAAVLLVVCIVMVIRAIFKPKDKTKDPSSSMSASQSDTSAALPTVNTPVAPDPDKWELILINPQTPMPDGFEPETTVVSSAGHTFDARASQALLDMIAACNKVEGNSLSIYSAYRGARTQNERHQRLVELFKSQPDVDDATAETMANEIEPMYPLSDHQTALGVDFIAGDMTEPEQSFANRPEYTWLMEHAAEYGFILRFPDGKSAITGITYQPYHFRYVGKEDAQAMNTAAGLVTLEEYLVQLPPTSPASTATSDASGSGSSTSGEDSGSSGSEA